MTSNVLYLFSFLERKGKKLGKKSTIVHMTPGGSASWQGGSGRTYRSTPLDVSEFVLGDFSIYMLVNAGHAIWVGTASDLIGDQASRSQFRRAVSLATGAFEFSMPHDQHTLMCLTADLCSGHPPSRLSAA